MALGWAKPRKSFSRGLVPRMVTVMLSVSVYSLTEDCNLFFPFPMPGSCVKLVPVYLCVCLCVNGRSMAGLKSVSPGCRLSAINKQYWTFRG